MSGFAGLLMATLAWGVLAFGAVYPWAYWPLAILAAVLGVWGLVATNAWLDGRVRSIARVLGAVAIAILVQAIAIPTSWVARWSPGVDRLLSNYEIGYQQATHHSLSISAEQTTVALILYVAFAVLLLGLMRAIRLVPFDWLAANLVGLGLALAVAAVVQAAFINKSDPLVYGFWRPAYGATPFGPFVNKNHFAGWMVMVLPVALSYLVAMVATARRPSHLDWAGTLRWAAGVGSGRLALVAVSLLIMSMAVVLTGSRSGMVSLVLGLGVVGMLVWTRTETRGARRMMTGGVLALGGGAVLWAGFATTLSRFGSAAGAIAGRWGAWQDTWHIARDFLAFGTGLGTYARAMLVYQTGDRTSIYAQAHNDYLQLLAEGGLLVIIPAIIAAGVIVKTIGRRLRSADDDTMTRWLRAGAVAGLVGIAAQSVVEFSLQMPGNTVMFVVLLALALHRPHRTRRVSHANRV
jgi:O-antigen ligase